MAIFDRLCNVHMFILMNFPKRAKTKTFDILTIATLHVAQHVFFTNTVLTNNK